MSAADVAVPVALAIVELGIDALRGRTSPSDAARRIVGVGLQLVPRDELASYLTQEGVLVAELAADAASRAKFGE